MEPIARKAAATVSTRAQQGATEGQKTAPSKFDRLRADLSQQLMPGGPLPPKVVSVTEHQKQVLANNLQQKLAAGESPKDIVGSEMNQLRSGIANVQRQVAATPNISAFGAVRERLKSIESDFNASAKLLDANVPLNDPSKLLEMQMQIYKMTENVEVLSRTVSETASGVKTLLQMQV